MSRHIVDTLIEERAHALMAHPRLWPLIRRIVFPLLGYHKAVEMVDSVQHMTGLEVFHHVSRTLNMRVDTKGVEHVPRQGAAILMPNHPAGIADGIAVFDAVKAVREDVVFFANRDAVRAAPALAEMIIPVEWMETRRDHAKSKETVRAMLAAFKAEKLVVIFPSGRLAQPSLRGLIERPWMSSGVALAQKYGFPVIPTHIRGHNSTLYYLLWYLNTELKDMTLFRELLNKAGGHYALTFAAPVTLDAQADTELMSARLRGFVVDRMPRGFTRFDYDGKIADTIDV